MPDENERAIPDEQPPTAPPGAGSPSASDGATAPGLAVGEGHDSLEDAPEPNEPA